MATPSKKVCRVKPEQRRVAGRGAHPVGLLAEMEVGREDVLGEVHGEVARQDIERRAR